MNRMKRDLENLSVKNVTELDEILLAVAGTGADVHLVAREKLIKEIGSVRNAIRQLRSFLLNR